MLLMLAKLVYRTKRLRLLTCLFKCTQRAEKSVSPKVVCWLYSFSSSVCMWPGCLEAGTKVSKCSSKVTNPALSSFRIATYESTSEALIA